MALPQDLHTWGFSNLHDLAAGGGFQKSCGWWCLHLHMQPSLGCLGMATDCDRWRWPSHPWSWWWALLAFCDKERWCPNCFDPTNFLAWSWNCRSAEWMAGTSSSPSFAFLQQVGFSRPPVSGNHLFWHQRDWFNDSQKVVGGLGVFSCWPRICSRSPAMCPRNKQAEAWRGRIRWARRCHHWQHGSRWSHWLQWNQGVFEEEATVWACRQMAKMEERGKDWVSISKWHVTTVFH